MLNNGFSLIELLVTMTIVGIIAGIALPSFNTMLDNNRATTIANSLITTLNFARNTAITERTNVAILSKSDTDKSWEKGWIVCSNIEKCEEYIVCSNKSEASETCEDDDILRSFESIHDDFKLRTGDNFKTKVTYKPTGRASDDAFILCTTDQKESQRTIVVNNTGRHYIKPPDDDLSDAQKKTLDECLE